MARWFRVYDDLVDDPKIQLLSGELVKSLLNLWCLASQNDGALPSMQTMSFKLRMKPAQVAAIITELSDVGLIDREGETFHPHNWNGRQHKSDVSTDRVKRFRERERNVSSSVSSNTHNATNETPPETEADTETERERTRASALSPGWPPDYREQFWVRFPNKVGKPLALKKLDRIARSPVKWDDLMAGLDRYVRSKPSDRPWLNPTTFLNQERWADQPASVVQLRRVPDV